jgi:hypothetical protein
MGISTPPPSVPQFPIAPDFTQVNYFDDMLYNAVLGGSPQDYSGVAGVSGGTPPIAVDVAHPGILWADLSVALPVFQWEPSGSGFTLSNYSSFSLEWVMQFVNPTAAVRLQFELGMSTANGCIQNTDSLGVQVSLPGATCANTPTGNFYLAIDSGGVAQYLDSGVNLIATQNTWLKFVIAWNASLNQVQLFINDVLKVTTNHIPAGVTKLPIFSCNGFTGGALTGFVLFDYLKFDGVITR